MSSPLLSVEHLVTSFEDESGSLRAVDDVSFSVARGRTLAVVGESGCGKSVTALSILQLVPSPPGRIEGGSIRYAGRELLELSDAEMRKVRGEQIAMIFQEPMTSLNPVFTIGSQVVEAIRIHRPMSREAARQRAVEMLRLVGIPSPAERIQSYPHQLSGGMRQRVMIAMALSCDPALLIADEPTTALDVTIQAQILELLAKLQRDTNMSILFITHDLGVVAEFAQDVVVMYAGRVVEQSPVSALFAEPAHPYSRGLMASVPPMGSAGIALAPGQRLPTIEGVVPDLRQLPPGCRFADRCELRRRLGSEAAICVEVEPDLVSHLPGRASRCHFSGRTL